MENKKQPLRAGYKGSNSHDGFADTKAPMAQMEKKKDLKFVYIFEGKPYINLTNRCCNDCEFCLRNNSSGIKGDTLWLEREPSEREVIDILDGLSFKYNEVVFCGYGESTYKLNEIIEIGKHLKSKNIYVRLNTNGLGSAINGFDITPLLAKAVDAVSVSLNESDPQKYDSICHPVFGLDAYGYILEFAKSCVLNNIKTTLTVVDIIGDSAIEKCKIAAKEIGAELRVRKLITDNDTYA